MRCLRICLIWLLLLLVTPLMADEIDDILNAETAPSGVVFEIVSGNGNLLHSLFPDMQVTIRRLRERFPDLDIAIVSHGEEQFALVEREGRPRPQVQAIAESLVENDGVSVHVCGTYASWAGVGEEQFAGFVDVTPAAPVQINHYRELGYVHIMLP